MALLLSGYKLAKSFAGKNLFSEVSFGVNDGDRIGLLGPNGAGKSTLLKIIAKQVDADSGDVTTKKGLTLGFLEQTPTFNKNETIMQALLSVFKTEDDRLEAMPNAYEWMAKLDLSNFGEDFVVDQLSGGWQKRVALARELMKNPELLLMDEPTNHLDISSILWLEQFIQQSPWATLVVTHDRLFLQRIANRIFDLDPRNPNNLLVCDGDYIQYLETKELLIQAQEQKEVVMKNTLRRETEWLRRGPQARLTKQKARIDRAYELKDDVSAISEKNARRDLKLDFGDQERGPQKLIEAKNIAKSYNGKTLFENFNSLVTPKTRLALLGDNGCGKSTLIKILIGQETPDAGSVKLADDLRVVYFEQSRNTLQPKQSLLKNICPEGDYVCFQGEYIYAVSYLERFLFKRQQMDLPVEKLSGGEQARLRLAQMMLTSAQVLILDEPTNDLDSATLQVLEDTLKEFNGAVILVTHDRYFMDHVADEIIAFVSAETTSHGSNLEKFTGYLQWEEWGFARRAQAEEIARSEKKKMSEASSGSKKKLSFKEKFELENMEANILKLETQLTDAQAEIEKPEVSVNATKVSELYQLISKLQPEIDRLYARWADLESREK